MIPVIKFLLVYYAELPITAIISSTYHDILFQITVLGGCSGWQETALLHVVIQEPRVFYHVPSPFLGFHPHLHSSAEVGKVWRNACWDDFTGQACSGPCQFLSSSIGNDMVIGPQGRPGDAVEP